MALVKCKECGSAISSNASACPKCGAPTLWGRFEVFLKAIGKIGFVSFVVISFLLILLWKSIFPDQPKAAERSRSAPVSDNTRQDVKTQGLSLSDRYPGPWREEFNLGITKALASKRIGGCGQYKYRESTKDRGEYVVYCTSDGRNWSAYLVWPAIGEVTGPHQPDPSLR